MAQYKSDCILEDIEGLATIAEEVPRNPRRDDIEQAFIASLSPEQKQLWLQLEEIMVAETVAVQNATVRAIYCTMHRNCHIK